MAIVRETRPDARLLLAGGKPDQVAAGARAGPRRPASTTSPSSPASGRRRRFPAYLLAADVLVSPRSRGTNTPLKIYQYLRSGTPDRRDATAHAHAGAERRHGRPDRASRPASSRRGILAGAERPGARGRDRAAGARAGRDEIQLRGVPRADASGLRRADGRPRPPAPSSRTWRDRLVRARATTTATPSTPIRRWRGRSTSAGSAGRSATSSPRRRRAVLADFVGRVRQRSDPRRRHGHRTRGAAAGARRRAR